MAITQTLPNTFKRQLLDASQNFKAAASGGNVFKLALYVSTATLGASTTSYTTAGEITNPTGSYSAGGGTLINSGTSVVGTTAFTNFSDISFTGVTLTARGALIYNTSLSNAAVAVLNFGDDKSATDGTFTIQFPLFTSSAAIIRIS